MKKKVDWIIALECNGHKCDVCGLTEYNFIDGFCNAYTYGMFKYGHPEFQLVLHMEHKMILYTLNMLGLRVQAGKVFKDGDIIEDLFEGYNALLKEFEYNGQKMLRVIIPDVNHKFPNDEGCQLEYSYQALPIEDLYKKDATGHRRDN